MLCLRRRPILAKRARALMILIRVRMIVRFLGGRMTDSEKLFSIMCFMMNEGLRVDDQYRTTLSYRTVRWRDCDQLDMLELIQLQDRVQYFNELDAVIGNILYDNNRPRPAFYPLTGLRYDGIL